jgi:two-component system cell cycle sensor histidine kinase/response regulator CckA
MSAPLRVLIVEDSPEDAALLVGEIRRGGHEVVHRRVETREALVEALEAQTWDVVLSDYNLPWFHGPGALQVVRESGIPVPFLLVSGAIGEHLAVHAVKQGAADYVMKGNLARLLPAIERSMRDARDRVERATAERRLRESEERYRRFFEEDLTGDFTADATGRVLSCNPAYARTFGFPSAADAVGTRLPLLPEPPGEREEFLALLRRRGKLEYHEAALRRQDGTPLHVVANLIGAYDESGELTELRGYVFDDTERKRLEEQLRRAQKMEAVGRLAGGIAHDFNNLLTAILGYSDLLIHRFSPTDPLRDHAAEIRRAGERASALVRQLLAYSRRQVLQPTVLDPNEVVSSVEGLLRRLLGEDVDLRLSLDERLPRVRADRSQLEQVLLNLAVNARDAMPRGGLLTVETRRVESAPGASPGALEPGTHALLSVTDTGCGMDEEVRAHVFEPFFTTKGPGKGTGLGLATVYGIVRQSGGRVSFETEVGRGTIFHVHLPAAQGEPEPAPAARPDAPARAKGGGETILLVEDEDVVRTLLARVLSEEGYRVLEAADALEALAACDRHAGPIHLMVTDIVMPRMSGRELADRVAVLRPGTRVLYVSGYADDAVLRHGVHGGKGVAFLQKPFPPDVLAEKVRAVLAQPRRAERRRVRPT